MSLPSTAYFFKNGSIIADTTINIGWAVFNSGLIKCCYEAYNYCLDQEKQEKNHSSGPSTAHVLDGWKNFDHIVLYGYSIPRIVLDEYFQNKITEDEFIQRLNDGSYLLHKCKCVNLNDKEIEKYRSKTDKKYDKL